MRKFTAFLLMVAPFLYTGLYASSADSKKTAWKYIDILDAQKQERERADANIEKAMTLPPQDAENACLSEWGVSEVTQETDPKRLFAVLANHVRNTNSVNSQFGYTFSEKNKPVMHDFIKGVESWVKDYVLLMLVQERDLVHFISK